MSDTQSSFTDRYNIQCVLYVMLIHFLYTFNRMRTEHLLVCLFWYDSDHLKYNLQSGGNMLSTVQSKCFFFVVVYSNNCVIQSNY